MHRRAEAGVYAIPIPGDGELVFEIDLDENGVLVPYKKGGIRLLVQQHTENEEFVRQWEIDLKRTLHLEKTILQRVKDQKRRLAYWRARQMAPEGGSATIDAMEEPNELAKERSEPSAFALKAAYLVIQQSEDGSLPDSLESLAIALDNAVQYGELVRRLNDWVNGTGEDDYEDKRLREYCSWIEERML